VCEAEFQKVLDLGADGILFDECLHHGPALLCFDESHGHRLGAMVYANDNELIRRLGRMAARVSPQFLFAGEACYDREFETYHLSYHRSENPHHVPLSRYIAPHAQLMTAVTGFNDRNMINQCLLYRYIISYEPYNFKGRLDDFPLTLHYGQQMDALRNELRETFWDGEYCGTLGAQVALSNDPATTHHPYAVFKNTKTNRYGVVVANYDLDKPLDVQVTLDNGHPLDRYRLVEAPQWRPVNAGITIPPCSAAALLE
jgi:hypothetical protein